MVRYGDKPLINSQIPKQAILKIWAPFMWRKVVSGRRVTLTAESALSSVHVKNIAPFDRLNSWLSRFCRPFVPR